MLRGKVWITSGDRRRYTTAVLLAALGMAVAGYLGLGATPSYAYQDEAAAPAEGEPVDEGTDTADAQADSENADESAASEAPDNFLVVTARANGWVFGPILLAMSIMVVAMITMNVMQVRRDILLPASFVEAFEQRLAAKDYQGAYETAKNDDSVIARVLAAGLSKLNRGYNEAVEGMQEVGEDENMALDHRLSYLSLLSTIAPMVGLAGTVWGMIGAFEEIATSPVAPKPKDLALNIYTALFTTIEGLAIAIPAMTVHSLLKNRADRLMLEIGIISEGLMGRFADVGKRPAGGAAPAAAPAAPKE